MENTSANDDDIYEGLSEEEREYVKSIVYTDSEPDDTSLADSSLYE